MRHKIQLPNQINSWLSILKKKKGRKSSNLHIVKETQTNICNCILNILENLDQIYTQM